MHQGVSVSGGREVSHQSARSSNAHIALARPTLNKHLVSLVTRLHKHNLLFCPPGSHWRRCDDSVCSNAIKLPTLSIAGFNPTGSRTSISIFMLFSRRAKLCGFLITPAFVLHLLRSYYGFTMVTFATDWVIKRPGTKLSKQICLWWMRRAI